MSTNYPELKLVQKNNWYQQFCIKTSKQNKQSYEFSDTNLYVKLG